MVSYFIPLRKVQIHFPSSPGANGEAAMAGPRKNHFGVKKKPVKPIYVRAI